MPNAPAAHSTGMVMVPREPTDAMGQASALKTKCVCERRITQWGVNAWKAMIEAALSDQTKDEGKAK